MGNNSIDKEVKNQINIYIKNLHSNIRNFIITTFKKTHFNEFKDIEDYTNKILDFLHSNFNSCIKKINNINEEKDLEENYNDDKNQNDDMINNIEKEVIPQNYNVFTSKDIQNYYSEIIDYFKRFSIDYFNDNNERENKTIGEFLESVANISRKSFNHSNEFLEKIYNDFENSNKNNQTIISSIDEFKLEFSNWVKNNEYIIFNCNLDKFLKSKIILPNVQNDEKTKNYLKRLHKELLILYFKCEISFPAVEVDFNKNENFDFDKMEDFVHNKGNKKLVNFIFFPSLFSNGNYLKNGKQWVFTYINNNKKQTFFFEKLNLEPLIAEEKKFNIPKLKDKLKLNIYYKKIIHPELNYKISEKVKKEYVFRLKNKSTQENVELKRNSDIEINENQELIKCDFYLMSKYILSFPSKDLYN